MPNNNLTPEQQEFNRVTEKIWKAIKDEGVDVTIDALQYALAFTLAYEIDFNLISLDKVIKKNAKQLDKQIRRLKEKKDEDDAHKI